MWFPSFTRSFTLQWRSDFVPLYLLSSLCSKTGLRNRSTVSGVERARAPSQVKSALHTNENRRCVTVCARHRPASAKT